MQFNYTAYSLERGLVKGKIDAENKLEAQLEVSELGFKALEIKPVRRLPNLEDIFPTFFKVKTGQLVRFSRQLATMVRGGSSLQRALEMLQSESGNGVLSRILGSIRKSVNQGGSLSAALAEYPSTFNTRYISVVQVGEHTGSLANSLDQLAGALEREHEAVQKFKRTMMMPLFTMGASVGMLILMMTVMLPPLLEAFESRGADVPLITKVAILIVGILHDNLLKIGIVLVVGATMFFNVHRVQWLHEWLHGVQTHMPIFGSLIVARELANFSRTNAMLLEAGVPLAKSLPLGIAGSKNLRLRAAFVDGEQSLLSGHGFAEALSRHPVLPRLWVEMVMIGEENNLMDQSLKDLADTYEKEVDNRLAAILALAEPMSTFAVGGVVLFMALSMFLPIYGGLESIK